MEQIISILIYVHAFFGGVGLITGIISIWNRKGSRPHKKAGKIFSFAMTLSALISLIVARMPGHENRFLFLIGIFTLYMVLSGNRALTFKSKTKQKADKLDYLISGTMLLTSAVMIVLGVLTLLQNGAGLLYLFFGGFGILMAMADFKMFRTFAENKELRLTSHVGRMVGALIASTTAFIVAGLNIGSLPAWIAPSAIGTIYIVYWSRKLKREKTSAVTIDEVAQDIQKL